MVETDRPYFRYSISELEELFEKSRSDLNVLKQIEHELRRHRRSRPRVVRLREKVAEVIASSSMRAKKAVGDDVQYPTEHTGTVVRFPGGSNQPAAPAHSKDTVQPNVAADPPPARVQSPPFPTPKGADEPAAILAAWIALEALSPQTYRRPEELIGGDRRCVVDLSNGPLPWTAGERSRPNYQLYYQVVLGAVHMDRATDDLVKAFGENDERPSRIREKAAIASIIVDRKGIPVEDKGIAVSSFAWAVPFTLRQELGALGAWPAVERQLIEKLDNNIRRRDRNDEPVPLDLATITSAHRWLVEQFGLPSHLVEPPTFVLRIFHYFRAKGPPEPSLLNSFFLGDLASASSRVNGGSAPAGLRRYLGIDAPRKTFDLLADKAAIEKAVAPMMMPAARWPTPGGFSLALLPQAAVNLSRFELAGTEGLIAINGPPGTGKTTLLRDVVATCVLDRALAMGAFDDPETAFTPSGQRIQAGENAFFHLYALHPSLKGHEILVASSNNKAVENISRELPARKAVGRDLNELSYFKSVSDVVFGLRTDRDGGVAEEGTLEPIETWGMIAAVLGNARNRASFQQSFWWHEDSGFRLYLKAAKGDSVVIETRDPVTGVISRRVPNVVQKESPPSATSARAAWRKARQRLLALKREIDGELEGLQRVRATCLQLVETRANVTKSDASLASLLTRLPKVEGHRLQWLNRVQNIKSEHQKRTKGLENHKTAKPWLLARVFRTARWKKWSDINRRWIAAVSESARALGDGDKALAAASAALDTLNGEIRQTQRRLEALRQEISRLTSEIEGHRSKLGDRLVDEQYFAKGHQSWNLNSPWLPDVLHRKREDLFIAALAVHRAFVDVAAQKVLHNLSAMMNAFSAGPPQDQAKRALLADLWSTLFMVVPVISTTFASVERMLGPLEPGSIGWLLIDEAGQALPQAAVGAILRAKRAIVVGDPLQIPPVVTLPDRLSSEICKFFKVSTPIWAAPDASAQTLADRASTFQASFRSDHGPRGVGIPLLVHRRCQEPMFSISNRIAYDDQMVFAADQPNPGIIGQVLGPSTWWDIDGEAQSKWCPAEGDLVVGLLQKLARAGVTKPDAFLITPFRIVAQELRRRLERETELFSALQCDVREWIKDRIGTIHTVQGREADTVILVLGAPAGSQGGARNWAAGTPNILNVAASRAKQNLYVVGSYGAWSGVGHARTMASFLPTIRV